MNLLRRLGFRKADEMDIHIALIAVRASWLVMLVALIIWSIYDAAITQSITIPFIIFLLGLLVYSSTDLYVRRKLSSDHRE